MSEQEISNTLEDIPVPKDLDDLVRILRLELGEHGLDDKQVNIERIQKIMANYRSCEEDWLKYAMFDKYRYTRNLIDDGNGKFNLLLLAWSEQQHSAIHDHSGSHCIMKLLDGELEELQYSIVDEDNGPMELIRMSIYERDQVTYIHGKFV
jgi:cysteine dioxygenase